MALLIYGDSRSYSLRHAIPLAFPTGAAYLVEDGKRERSRGAHGLPVRPRGLIAGGVPGGDAPIRSLGRRVAFLGPRNLTRTA